MSPDDERARRAEVERGHQARQITEHPLWSELWEGYRSTLLERITDPTSPDDVVLEARRMLILCERVQRDLGAILETGHLAAMQLEEHERGRH